MKARMELVGKTISGVVASVDETDGRHRIWMLQFTDGTHVEFVSPGARRSLGRLAGVKSRPAKQRAEHPQLAFNVA